MTIKDLKPGQSGVITAVGGEGALRQHFLDMGVIPGAEITVTKLAPLGDPMELRIHGYELTLRLADAEKIARTAERPLSSTSSPAPISTWETFPASPWTGRTARSGDMRTP